MDLQIVIIIIVSINILISLLIYFKLGSINPLPKESESDHESEPEPEPEPVLENNIVKKGYTAKKKVTLADKEPLMRIDISEENVEENVPGVNENAKNEKVVFHKREPVKLNN